MKAALKSGGRAAGLTLAGAAMAALLGALFGSGAYTFRYAEGASYLSDDPRACVNCHIMREQFDGWQKASHHAHATCNDCHVPHELLGKYVAKATHGYRHSKAFTFQDFHEPIRITATDRGIVERNCVRCHEGLVGDIGASGDSHGRGASCIHCHISVGHGPTR